MKIIIFALFMSLLGCAGSEVLSTVETFHELPPNGGGRSIVILPASDKVSDLEFRNYSARLGAHFTEKGYRVLPVTPDARPDYVAFFAYGVDNGQLVSRTYTIPHWGVTGYSGANTTGTLTGYGNMATYNATTSYTPQYGITGYSTGVTTDTVYTRAIILNIYDIKKLPPPGSGSSIDVAQVYTGKLVSSGGCGNMSGVLDALLAAMFKDFPGQSGHAQRVSVPNKTDC